MAKKQPKTLDELAELIANHQALIQKIGVNWGEAVIEKLDATEKALLVMLSRELKKFGPVRLNSALFKKFREIEKAVKEIRSSGFDQAYAELDTSALNLAANDAAWAAGITQALGAEKLTTPTLEALEKIPKYGVFDGKSLREWFTRLTADDTARIMDAIRSGIISGLTIDEIARQIAGTAKNDYKDGILSASRTVARRLARTAASGVANDAKMEFYQENSDVVLGVDLIATLDGRVCPRCASLDGRRYKLDESKPHLPIHPNCRCIYVPVTVISDMGEDERPAANADFTAEAKRLYEQKYPKDKFPNKSWDKLAPSTRHAYYYEAMHKYEKQNLKPAYSRVPGKMSFKEWFPTTSEQFKRDWLGPARYELYEKGKLPLNDFLPPYPDKQFTLDELKRHDAEAFRKAGLS